MAKWSIRSSVDAEDVPANRKNQFPRTKSQRMFSPIGSWNFVLGIWFLVLRSSPGGLWIMRSCWTSRSIILWALAAPCICLARAHTPPCSLCSPWFDCWPRGTRGPRGPTIQNPYDHLPIPDIGLKPLLRSADGKTINTKQAWEEQRRLLRVAWLKRLGEPLAAASRLWRPAQ